MKISPLTPCGSPRRRRPGFIEPLEARIAPAGVVFDHSASGDGVPDQLILARDGGQLTLTINGALARSWEAAAIDSLAIIGSGDDDTLIVDLGSGAVVPPGGLDFDGGPGFDTLDLRGGAVAHETHVAFDAHSGVITLDGREVRYRAIEPVGDTGPAASFTFTAPPGGDTISLDNGPGAGEVTISSGTGSFESITFANKTTVTINAADGANIFNLNGTSATGLTTLTLNGGPAGGVDTFHINAATVPLTLNGGGGDDVFTFADGVTLNGGTLTGGAGTNSLDLSAYTTAVNVHLGNGTSTIGTLATITNLTGGAAGDTLTGNGSANIIHGGPGADAIAGAPGGDQLSGDAGDDLLVWNNGDGSDVIDGGADNDTVQVNGSPTGGDQFLIQVHPAAPARLLFNRTSLGPFSLDIGTTEALDFKTLGGDDTTTVDFAGGNPIPINGLAFDGGTGDEMTLTSDRLVLQRSSGTFLAAAEIYTPAGADAGEVSVDGRLIHFSSLAPIDDTLPATNFTFNAPDGGQAINVIDGPMVSGFQTAQISSGAGSFELINFANKANTTINGSTGADTIKVAAPSATGALTVNGNDGADFFKVTASVSATIHVEGGAPGGKSGDVLDVETNGVPSVLGAGLVTTTGAANITFAGIESAFLSNRTLRVLSPTTATYFDTDGDLVTIKTTVGTLGLEDFQLALNAAGTGAQLLAINLTPGAGAFANTNLTITAKLQGGKGDGFANVGFINALGTDLGKVTIAGDLGKIEAGDNLDADTALAALTVQSLGVLGTFTQAPGGDLGSDIRGRLGALSVKSDLIGASISSSGAAPSIGNVFIGGDVVGGNDPAIEAGVFSFGSMGSVTIRGSIVGGSTTGDSSIFSSGAMGAVTVGGSLLGGSGESSGRIQSGAGMGAVVIKGDIVGGTNGFSGQLFASGNIASVTLGGSLLGGNVPDPALDFVTGAIQSNGSIPGGVTIGGSVRGSNGDFSGFIDADGSMGPVTIGGSLEGGAGTKSGSITVDGALGTVTIGGDVRGGAAVGAGSIRSVTSSIAGLTVGGSIVAAPGRAQGIFAITTLGPVMVGGDIRGDAVGSEVFIYAGGLANKADGIKSVTVNGSVKDAIIAAGLHGLTLATNPDSGIGAVSVGGNWIASTLSAGLDYAASGDFVGDADDVKPADPVETKPIFSRIASITIGGFVAGTVGPGSGAKPDHFGFVAEEIGKLSIGGIVYPVTAGLDKVGFALGATGDVRAREIEASPAVFPAPTPPASAAPLIYAVDENGNLISFRADAPGTIITTANIGGLGANERIEGMDFRPATGQLYALGITDADSGDDSGRVLRINFTASTATAVAVGPAFSTALADGQHYGFDFDPVADRIRLVGHTDLNLRLNPDDGTAATDTPVDDPSDVEEIFAVAYDRNFVGATATALYGIEFQRDRLVRIGDVDGTPGSANGGVVTPLGALTPGSFLTDSQDGGLDIEARTGAAYAVFFDVDGPIASQTNLYTINLGTGAAALVGAVGTGTVRIRDMAVGMPNDLTIVSPTEAVYFDEDGDRVTVKTSLPGLDAGDFTFATGQFGSRLLRLDLDDEGPAFAGADITITAVPFAGRGDGFANVGHLDASNADLAKVTIHGDLGRITAGDPTLSGGTAVAALTVHSMGLFGLSTQLPGADFNSNLDGRLGALTVKTDLKGARIASFEATPANGSMGDVFVGGSVVGGAASSGIFSSGAMGNVTLGGSLFGGSVVDSGKIESGGAMGKVTFGGSIIGGTAEQTGVIKTGGTMGAVVINGDILGGTADNTGGLNVAGSITSITLGGSLVARTIAIPSSSVGSGVIITSGGTTNDIGPVNIGGSVLGGNSFSGVLFAFGHIASVAVAGSVVGSTGAQSGSIFGVTGVGPVTIGGDLRGGATTFSGTITNVSGDLGPVTLGGSLTGIGAGTGIISAGNLGAVKIAGSVRGNAPGGARIQAEGVPDSATAAIAGLSVKGGVRNALILAGYDDALLDMPTNPDAGIGAVKIDGNWLTSSLIAGAAATDTFFGNANDVKITEPIPDAIFATIASITIKGFAAGTPGIAGDHFGFVAEQIGKLKIGAVKVPLTPGTDTAGFPIGATGDLRVREV
ncbi:MAG: hypothetical protein QOE70_1232 [Chthoniobacter sp.]|jgi:hypothetical protein|nr:hypothetical protein [Chthoniobacter sp.]